MLYLNVFPYFLHKLHILFVTSLHLPSRNISPRSPSTRPCGGEGLRRDLLAFYVTWRSFHFPLVLEMAC